MTTTASYSFQDQATTAPQGSRRALRQHRVFFAATAAVMLHVADDNFFQPVRGTTAGEHLHSGLVPLALLALGAVAFPQVRVGARALIALAIGLTALLVGGIESGYYTATVGPSGDDYTGFLAAAAGPVLVGLGVVALWRSRRAGPTRTRQYLRRGLRGVVGLVLVGEVIAPFALGYLTTHVLYAEVPEPELGAAYDNISFTTSDGLRLEGWYVPSRNGAAVIAFNRTKARPHARMLIRNGYGVLLVDRRGEGASDGEPNMYGWGGARDIHAAVEFLEDRPDVDPGRIGGLGLSVGGELMLQAAAENPALAAVVSEGAGTRTMSEVLKELDKPELIRGFHSLLATQAGVMLFSKEPPPPSLVDLAPRIGPKPVLLIWAPNGGNREGMNPTYRDLIGPSASIWSIPDAQHVGGIKEHPEAYERHVIRFFDRALLGDLAEE
jgi:uncharacterized protein